MQLPNAERTREELRRLYRHPQSRYWGAALALFLIVVTVLAFLLSSQDTTPVDNFVRDTWRQVMESQDSDAYADLWDGGARDEWAEDFDAARSLVERQRLKIHLSGIRATTDPVDSKGYIVRQIPVTFERDGEEVTTHHTLRLARKGLLRHWKLVAHNITFPEAEPSPVVQLPTETEASGGQAPQAAGTEGAGFELSTGSAPLDTQLKLRQIVGAWRTAWETRNLDEYMGWYADKADITRVSVIKGKEYPRKLRKDQLRRHMERLNKKYNKIQVTLSNIEIVGDDAVADVNFLQEYRAWSNLKGKTLAYRDVGTKRLKFMVDPEDGEWRIYAETWKIYRDVPIKL